MSNQYVFISGAAGGIGKATVLMLTQSGFTVFAGVLNEQEADTLKQLKNENIIPIQIDISNTESIANAMDSVKQQLPAQKKLFALVNNAGVNYNAPLKYLSEFEIRQTINVNLAGSIFLTQAVLPLLEQNNARIIFTGSATGLMASPTISVYAATKFALEGFADSLRVELGTIGIYVTIIEPGVIQTPMTAASPKILQSMLERMTAEDRGVYEGTMRKIVDMSCAKDVGSPPETVAKLITKAMTAAKPKSRYQAGNDATATAYLRHLPDSMRDFIQRKLFKLP